MHRPTKRSRAIQTYAQKKSSAYDRILARLGEERIDNLKQKWNSLNIRCHGVDGDGDVGDGIITCLQKLNFSFIEIQSILPIGSSRLTRVIKLQSSRNREKRVRRHALSTASRALFSSYMESLDCEDGFPCAHRRPKRYIISDNVITWKAIYENYVRYVEMQREENDESNEPIRVMALTTFIEYKNWLYPGYNTIRKKEDVCDSCVRLNFIMSNPNSTQEEIDQAKLEKEMHVSAAVDQRRAIKKFSLKYMDGLCLPVQPVNLPDFADGDIDGETEEVGRKKVLSSINGDGDEDSDDDSSDGIEVTMNKMDRLLASGSERARTRAKKSIDEFMALILAEDYGQGIAMPHYGINRPQSDYFNSNLMINLYVQSDISRGKNKIMLYDERTMGKEKNALCSLRLNYHVESFQRCLREGRNQPEIYISTRDNCAGQNKSNVTLQFDCLMSLSFYKRVMVIYLIPGHSHMLPDRVVAWAKRSLYRKNLYHPDDIVKEINNVKSVSAEFISHTDRRRPCYTGWEGFLGKYLAKLPSGFTSNYVFEFHAGNVTMTNLISDDPSDAVTIPLCQRNV